MTDLIALAERVEALSGPCRETDVLIIQALHTDIGPCEPHCAGETPIFWNDPLYKKPCPPLTTSVDAVLALIETKRPGYAARTLRAAMTRFVPDDTRAPDHLARAVLWAFLISYAATLRAIKENNDDR